MDLIAGDSPISQHLFGSATHPCQGVRGTGSRCISGSTRDMDDQQGNHPLSALLEILAAVKAFNPTIIQREIQRNRKPTFKECELMSRKLRVLLLYIGSLWFGLFAYTFILPLFFCKNVTIVLVCPECVRCL